MHVPYLHSSTGMSSHGFVSSLLFRNGQDVMIKEDGNGFFERRMKAQLTELIVAFFVGKSVGHRGLFNKELNI